MRSVTRPSVSVGEKLRDDVHCNDLAHERSDGKSKRTRTGSDIEHALGAAETGEAPQPLAKRFPTLLLELGETLEDAPTCLLCFEAAHDECHRAVIVDALEARLGELDVVHLQ